MKELKFKGVRKVVSDSKGMGGRYHLQLNYNVRTGEVWADQCVGNHWVRYSDRDIYCCGYIYDKITMNEVKVTIREFMVNIL